MSLSRGMGRVQGLSLALAMLTTAVSGQAYAACDTLLPPVTVREGPLRSMTVQDLLGLRDIGDADGSATRQVSPLAVSPDGHHIAFLLRRADPVENDYCIGLVSADASGKAQPVLLDRGGEAMLLSSASGGRLKPIGEIFSPAPAWSPDGSSLAYLRRDGGHTRVWRVDTKSQSAVPVTDGRSDVEYFGWSRSGDKIIYATRAKMPAFEDNVDVEGRAGWLFDGRVVSNLGPRPRPNELPLEFEAVDMATGSIAQATEAERTSLNLYSDGDMLPPATADNGTRAWIEADRSFAFPTAQLLATDADGKEVICTDEACASGLTGFWWNKARDEVRFLRREGWQRDVMALYRWRPGTAPHLILRRHGTMMGCTPSDDDLICLAEDSTQPRRLVRVDIAHKRIISLFDPNPEFKVIRLGAVRHLRWRNDLGLAARGDLVLPPDQRAGERLPLIVVQYRSSGFLRGGTGDEFPIQLFAAHGFAVLSIERVDPVAQSMTGLKGAEASLAANMKGWRDRWSVHSSLMTGVRMAIATGAVDPARIGITGLSDGATTARFALIHEDLFAAASISSCCVDPNNVMTLAGPEFADSYRAMGAPPTIRPDAEFWKPNSLALNAEKINRPLLMQVADDEFILSLESVTALREQGQPVEMYVFPGEHHVKWQPAHRAAIYARNLDWFRYWLKGERDPDPGKAAQYARWDLLRERRDRGHS